MTTASTAKPKTKPRDKTDDAIEQLSADHKAVKALFKEYVALVEGEGGTDAKLVVAQQICTMLTVHATVEEEVFYPAAREVLGDDADLIDEADVEHATAKDLIAQIEGASPDDDELYDARVKVLGEYIDHHVKEEEGEIFPKVKKAKVDVKALGVEMAARKEVLLAEMGAEA